MKSLLLFLGIIVGTSCSFPAFTAESYTLYLVRHAEKQKNTDTPHLTQCGRLRAKQLANTLKNVKLQAVYSTSYFRTLETASPSANMNKLGVKQYSPRGLKQLARSLKQDQQNALIVGHSNTTPKLAQLLTGYEVEEIAEDEYHHLFQIHIAGDNASLIKLIQPLVCHKTR